MPDITPKYSGEGDNKTSLIEINESLLGLNQFNTVKELVDSEMKKGIHSFVFDMSGLNSINSSGLGILISCFKNIKDSKGTLEIKNCNEKILGIFKLTKLDTVFGLQ